MQEHDLTNHVGNNEDNTLTLPSYIKLLKYRDQQ